MGTGQTVTFDFDDTLLLTKPNEDWGSEEAGPNEPILTKLREHLAAGDCVLIVTSRWPDPPGDTLANQPGQPTRSTVQGFLDRHDLVVPVVFTSGKLKAGFLFMLNSSLHFDDDEEELAALTDGTKGVLVPIHPDWEG